MILTTKSRMLLMLAALAVLVLLPVHLPVEAQRRDNRELRIHEVKQLPSKAKRFALVIGVDEYRDKQINRLYGAAKDAQTLRDALVKYAGFPEDQVTLLATGEPEEARALPREHTATAIEPERSRAARRVVARIVRRTRNATWREGLPSTGRLEDRELVATREHRNQRCRYEKIYPADRCEASTDDHGRLP